MDCPEGRFLLRVYALLFTRDHHLLLSSELYQGLDLVKFPGGGVHFGEGLRRALSRELKEELDFDTDEQQWEHYYTTDFFQISAFHPGHQVISVYYKWPRLLHREAWEQHLSRINARPGCKERFFFIPLTRLSPDQMTLPIDRHVAGMICNKFSTPNG